MATNMRDGEHERAELEFRKVASFYDDVYYKGVDAVDGGRESRHLRALAERLDLRPGESMLDVACGAGEWLAVAARRGLGVAGVDISQRAIEACRQRLPRGDFRVGPAERLDFPDASFDCVTCLGSLEHFLDQIGAVREMVRVLKPGGRILILVPNAGFLPYRLGLYRGTHQQAVRETIRPLAEWAALFEAGGLRVVDRWRDLHVLDRRWIFRAPWSMAVPRLVQALLLALWPLGWQYQVHHLCRPVAGREPVAPSR